MAHPSHFHGVHCETVATGTLLENLGYVLSEPMLFGVGEGLGFVFLNLTSLPLPFIGGRSKPFELTQAACRNLHLRLEASETSSKTKAWSTLEARLRSGVPVGLQVDCFFLPYFEHAPHFAGHFVAATRCLGDEEVELVDTMQQGSLHRVPRAALERARHARGPMSARARSYTVRGDGRLPLKSAVWSALRNNALRYLTPAFSGMGAPGLAKLARSLPLWLSMSKSPGDLRLAADLMERAGTGGALFRNLYRDFLDEASRLLPRKARRLVAARDGFARSAAMWTELSLLLEQSARDGRARHLLDAAALCRPIADTELAAMALLARS
jgi:hypothetical protein